VICSAFLLFAVDEYHPRDSSVMLY